ncbi:hypothetical protein LJC56_07585 [Christensenellaceae bacterium OttesenSCG-928-K19]|nr:hypothetical protein [Christensenellaceae bacterium OttesenSCG-928-K19]
MSVRKKPGFIETNREELDACFSDREDGAVVTRIAGVGGAGCRMVTTFAEKRPLARCVYIDTDAQALFYAAGKGVKLHLGGKDLYEEPNAAIGELLATESYDEIERVITPAEFVFLVAGLGGSMGGALPVIAGAALECGALCVSIVTMPFAFEGNKRTSMARETLAMLRANCDAVIVLPNEQIINHMGEKLTLPGMFQQSDKLAGEVLACLWDTLCAPGAICVEPEDLKNEFRLSGAMVSYGRGEASGRDGLIEAFEQAVSNTFKKTGLRCGKDRLITPEEGGDMRVQRLAEEEKGGSISSRQIQKEDGWLEMIWLRDPEVDNGAAYKEFYDDVIAFDDLVAEPESKRICLLHIRADNKLKISMLNDLLEYITQEKGYEISTIKCELEEQRESRAVVTVFKRI